MIFDTILFPFDQHCKLKENWNEEGVDESLPAVGKIFLVDLKTKKHFGDFFVSALSPDDKVVFGVFKPAKPDKDYILESIYERISTFPKCGLGFGIDRCYQSNAPLLESK